ncbi:putative fatty acyl-CoA reductase CG5065 [Achroia grisella]|uniref:putative fatty acyl-CoA reductase CG5065 n=1 Tax=Achroia grisella TaxID=688607 RepID=UPI0027D240C2|nr:putative fatty acyl-CoA reductase CG5065 [Achroia grisella]
MSERFVADYNNKMVGYCQKNDNRPLIPAFYAGRCILITGGTGFMGKVLVERLLSTCPNVDKLYLLMRQKKGVSPEKRLQELKQSQVFDVIRQSNPSQLDKLYILPGDITKPDVGLSQESIAKLHEVSVVFHSAATLKFDEAMKTAVEQNVLSVIRLMDICDRLPNMEAFIHISTAYSNAELSTIEERVYPSPAPLEQLLAVAESVPNDLMTDITPRYIAPKPNTYTFTKAMAEYAVTQHGNRGYPIAIFRPTIVVSSVKHPFPGWIENLNGPSGVAVAAGKGLLHVFRCNSTANADMLPVDIAIDTLLAVAWETATDRLQEVRVYNCTTSENPTTWGDFENEVMKNIRLYPMDKAFWWPCGTAIHNKYLQKTLELLLQTVPLHLTEYIFRVLGIKTQLSLITVSRRLRAMNSVLNFFALREWRFVNTNVQKLRARLTPQDAAIYNLDPKSFSWDELYLNFAKGVRKYLLKEKDQDLGEARQHLKRMFYLHTSVTLLLMGLLMRFALQNNTIHDLVYGSMKFILSIFNRYPFNWSRKLV